MSSLLASVCCCAPLATPIVAGCSFCRGHIESLSPCPLHRCARTLRTATAGVAIVTGGNRGVGWHTAKTLLNQGLTVFILCRSLERGAYAAASLSRLTGGHCESFVVDLGDLATIQTFLTSVAERRRKQPELRLLALVNNAGTISCDAMRVNHLGHFALTVGLVPWLRMKTGSSRGCGGGGGGGVVRPRIVSVASVAHVQGSFSLPREITVLQDMTRGDDSWQGGGDVDSWSQYSTSKAANVVFSHTLARRLGRDVAVASYHPGVMASDLWLSGDELGRNEVGGSAGVWRECCRATTAPCIKHPCISAAGLAALAFPRCAVLLDCCPDWLTGSSGGYYQQCLCCCVCPVRPMPSTYSTETGDRLWDASLVEVRRAAPDLGARLEGIICAEALDTGHRVELRARITGEREEGGEGGEMEGLTEQEQEKEGQERAQGIVEGEGRGRGRGAEGGKGKDGGRRRHRCSWVSPALPCTEVLACAPYCACWACLV